MAGPNKQRMLDDEMSRFEAEISGPTGMEQPVPTGMDLRPIIGANTFAQVKQQLKQATDDTPLRPQLGLPGFSGPQMGQFRMSDPMGPPDLRPGPPQGPGPGMHQGPGCGPNSFGPRPPMGFNQGQFRPNMNHPGPPGPGPGPGPYGPNIGPQAGPPLNSFPPPPPPPGFMGPHLRGGGGINFGPPGMPPHISPGFVPPQVSRAAMNNMGPMNNGMGPSMIPRPNISLLRPPPPPPGLMNQRLSHNQGLNKNGSAFFKVSAVISSAPKLYTAQSKTEEEKKPQPAAKVVEAKRPAPEPKKKQKKKLPPETQKKENSHALEMAEKVKQSTTTTKLSAPSFHHHQGAPQEEKKKEKKPKKNLRYAGGQIWEDSCLAEWDPDDFRMFAGDLGNDVTDELLHRHFSHYPSFARAKVVRDKRTNKSKGYGFISFKDSQDYIRAMKEMNGKYLGSRPIKLRKSMWRDRNLDVVQKKLKEKQLLGLK